MSIKGGRRMNDWGQTEVCPHCECESFYSHWDPVEKGYIAKCQHCGKEMMLCDACTHAEDNPNHKCDWHKENGMSVCFRGTHKLWEE